MNRLPGVVSLTSVPFLICVAIGVRWLFCFVLHPEVLYVLGRVGKQYYFDSYRDIAIQLWLGNGYRVAPDVPPALNRPPGYVLFMMACNPTSELSHLWFQFFHGLLGGLAVWLTIRMSRVWGLSQSAALFAGWSVALWPFLVWETKVSVPENLLVALIPAMFLTLGKWSEEGKLRCAACAGLLAGVAALTHGLHQILILPLMWTIVVAPQPRSRKAPAALVAALMFASLVLPWVVRNQRIAGYPIGVASGFGYHYFARFEPPTPSKGVTRGVDPDPRVERAVEARNPADVEPDRAEPALEATRRILLDAGFPIDDDNLVRSDPEINRFLDRRATEHLLSHPGAVIAKIAINAPLLWVRQRSPLRMVLNAVMLLPFAVLAIWGVARGFELAHSGLLIALFLVNLAAAAVYSEAVPMRYALPILPLLFFFSGRGFSLLTDQALSLPGRSAGYRFPLVGGGIGPRSVTSEGTHRRLDR